MPIAFFCPAGVGSGTVGTGLDGFRRIIGTEEPDAEEREADAEQRALRRVGLMVQVVEQHAHGEIQGSKGCQQGHVHQLRMAHVAGGAPQHVAEEVEEGYGDVVHWGLFFMFRKFFVCRKGTYYFPDIRRAGHLNGKGRVGMSPARPSEDVSV